MCMICYQPAGDAPVSGEIFTRCWDANHDGFGFMFSARGKLQICKPFYKLKHAMKAYYDAHSDNQDSPFVLHFRWSTHGDKSANNVHPHILADGAVGLVHNGVLDDFTPWGDKRSDTAVFCETVLAQRTPDQLLSREFNEWLAKLIGVHNKFVIMADDGRVSIVNNEAGEWDGSGRWYSNGGYKPQILKPFNVSHVPISNFNALPTAYQPKRREKNKPRRAKEKWDWDRMEELDWQIKAGYAAWEHAFDAGDKELAKTLEESIDDLEAERLSYGRADANLLS